MDGNKSANTLTGTAGADDIDGRGGNDVLSGLGGDDIIYGGAGADLINGGAGTDHLYGGSGADRFAFRAGNAIDVIEDFALGRNHDTVEVDRSMFGNFRSLLASAHDVGSDVWIDHGTDHLVLNDVHRAQLSADYFLFV
jgi:Ca2+-binding RTX toxin-like protein